MPNKLRQLSGKEVLLFFQKLGYEVKSQRGSHIKLKRLDSRIILIPNHKIIDKSTLKAIFNQALVIVSENELRKFFYSDDR